MTGSGLPALVGPTVLVPVKSFGAAKARLAPRLGPAQRALLARHMAERVLDAAKPLPVAVVCEDDEVALWAREQGAFVLLQPGRGLNGAVAAGVKCLNEAGASEVLVVHADIPMAQNLSSLAGWDGITLVPDRREEGTNVVCLPSGQHFGFSYGPGSFARHLALAHASGLKVRVMREPTLSRDVDVPEDIDPEILALARLDLRNP